jgi:DNA-binding CsgD family transcriptional regulator
MALVFRWPFVGRGEELRLIRETMAVGAGIVLAGVPGVGKTRLAYEAVRGADPDRYIGRWTAATAATAPIPFGALAPLLPAGLPGSAERVNVLRAAADALVAGCGDRRLILGIDDAHLLDATSAALIRQLAEGGRCFVLASIRSGEPAPAPVTALWKEEITPRLELQPLSQPETHDVLVAALGGHVDGATSRRLWRAARGNMLLLRELVVAGLDCGALTEVAGVWRWEGPWVVAPRLAELVTERMGRLAEAEQQVLEIVAHGEPLSTDLLAVLADPAAVDAVEDKGLLCMRHDDARVQARLAHPLYGDVLRARCPALRARTLRRRLADAVEATMSDSPQDLLRIVTWRLDAGAPVRTEQLTAAARRAFAVLDLPLAERLALVAFEQDATPSAGEVLWRVLFLMQRNAEVEDLMARLAGLAMTDEERGRLTIGRAYNLFYGLDRPEATLGVLGEARDAITDATWRYEIDFHETLVRLFLGDVTAAEREIASILRRSDLSARVRAQALVAHGMALTHLGRPLEATPVLERAAGPIAAFADEVPWVAATCPLYLGYAQLFNGNLTAAEAAATDLYGQAAETDWEFALRLACGLRSEVARLRGQVRTSARWAREGARMYARQARSFFRSYVVGELAHAEALAGNGPAAAAALAEADRTRYHSEEVMRPWIELARPWVCVANGDRSRGVELALTAAADARDRQEAGFEAFALHDAARLGAARAVTDRLRELADSGRSDLVVLLAGHAAATARGDPDALESAGAAFAETGAALLAAESYAQAANAHQKSGRTASATRMRAHAGRLLRHCEGARTPALTDIVAPQLTPRELDIARLAADGLSTQQIAVRLVISRRTVDNHLHQVYSKLGINGRSGLAGLLGRGTPPAGDE